VTFVTNTLDSPPQARAGTTAPGVAASNSAASSHFIDFYQLLDSPTDATTTYLRRVINELYSEAQSNRDHRNANKRRRYEALCELLPYCRIVLLDPGKRARYDLYREQVASGITAVLDFEDLMNELVSSEGESADGEGRVSLPGIENDDAYLPVSATTAHNGKSAARAPRASGAPRTEAMDEAIMAGAAGQPRQLSRSARDSLIGSAFSVVVFTIVFAVAWFISHDLSWAVLPASLAGILDWIIVHRKLASSGISAAHETAAPGKNRVSS
jgi:hypothetical protein